MHKIRFHLVPDVHMIAKYLNKWTKYRCPVEDLGKDEESQGNGDRGRERL
ncbi:hypothetical protein IWQ49_000308 [Labrenzia sp. EL_126]|nr:hypothetical protein [Labrenzia sp. EL_126]